MTYVTRLAMAGLVLAAAGCGDGGSGQDPAPTSKPASAPATRQAAREAAPGPLIVDVRTAGEFGSGHVIGAANLPYDTIDRTIGARAPDLGREIVLYCRSGARAGAALRTLRRMGYTNVTIAGTVQNMIDSGHTVQ